MGANDNAVYRLGGISALAIAGLYVVITTLYMVVGLVPTGALEWLQYLGPDANVWWAIVILSAVTDFLFLPVALAVYRGLRGTSDVALLIGTGLIALFAIIDLAVTQMNFATLIGLSVQFGAASGAQQSALVVAATYPSAVIDSFMLGFYVILVPGLGSLAVSSVMRKAGLGRATSWVGIAAGAVAVVAVVGAPFVTALGQLAIPAALLTTIWVGLTGRWLWGKQRHADTAAGMVRMEAVVPARA